MKSNDTFATGRVFALLAGLVFASGCQNPALAQGRTGENPGRALDTIEEAQTSRSPTNTARPEQRKTEHDRSTIFSASNAPASSPILKEQPEQGEVRGFDFARDPLNAKRPMQTAEEIMQTDQADRPKVKEAQRKLLESRYELSPKFDPNVTMSRGKPVPIGPTAKRKDGLTWEQLSERSAADIRKAGAFPYPSLPHPKHTPGGQVFPQAQIEMFPRLERFDVDFDLPEAFLPEFPPAIFLQNRPELGDVSRGEVVSIFQHIGILSLEFHVDKLSRPLL